MCYTLQIMRPKSFYGRNIPRSCRIASLIQDAAADSDIESDDDDVLDPNYLPEDLGIGNIIHFWICYHNI